MKYSITSLALLLVFSQSLFGQSALTRQLQQKLSDRKSAEQTKKETGSADQAPATDAGVGGSPIQPTTPQKFTDALQLAVLGGDLEAYNRLVSWPTILARATSKLTGEPITEFRTQFLKDVKGSNSLGAKIIRTVEQGGSYEFMKLAKNDRTVVAIFRMLLPGGRGVNYHEYSLAKTKTGDVVASDVYVYLTGEPLSDSIRRNLVTALGQDNKNLVKLEGNDRLLADNVKTIEELTTALQKNDAKTAREKILALPKNLRTDKAILALTLNVYRNSTAFGTVLAGVRKSHPKDVFMDMISIDIWARQKKYDLAIESIERIRKRVGDDPYLKVLEGRMLLNQNKKIAGQKLIREAVSQDDGLLGGYWNLVSFALADKNHEETLRLLQRIHQKFKIKFKDLREIPSYKEFVKSSQFQKWQEYIGSSVISEKKEAGKSSTGADAKRSKESSRRTATRTGQESAK